jgi:signal transduction histidine kinase
LRLWVYFVCGGAFLADVTSETDLAYGVFYIPLVSTAVYYRNPSAPWLLATLATAMVIVGFFLPLMDPDIFTALTNRILSVAAIFMTAYLIHQERLMRAQLARQTTRAEAADRAKAQLFNNLSHELRTPLSAILGFADLLMNDARPDQQAALAHIQGGGRRLQATLDNLIDLIRTEDWTLRARPLDLGAVLLDAVESSRQLAIEKSIALSVLTPDGGWPPIVADRWALHRIVDNLVANGVKFTEPGGLVEVSAHGTPDGIAVTVRDSGAGMPPDVLKQIGEPFFQADSGVARRFEGMGTGLALSLRLADAMGAALHLDSVPGRGTTASLVLPPGV